MERYEKYKDSGIEWIGEIPEHWEIGKFTHNVYLRHGFQFRDFDFTTSGIKIVKITQLKQNGQLDVEENISYIDSTRLDEFKDILIEKGDILMALTGGTIGKIIRVEEVCEPLLQNYRVGNFFPLKSNLEKDYLFWVLSSNIVLEQIFYDIRENGQPNIGKENFSRMFMPLPNSREVQIAIAFYLDQKTAQIDRIIANKQRLIAHYEEEKQAIINQAVTKGLDPNVPMKPSGVEWLGDIPEHWEVKKLNYCFQLIGSGTTPTSGKPEYYENGVVNWLQTGDLNDSDIIETSKKITQLALTDYTTLKFYPINSIVIAMYGATIGKTGLLKIESTTNQACCVLSNPIRMDCKYVFYWFNAIKKHIISLSYGGGQPNINQEQIRSLKIQQPPMVEQSLIVNHIEKEIGQLNNVIKKYKEQIDLFQEYRTTLISEVVTGKVKV